MMYISGLCIGFIAKDLQQEKKDMNYKKGKKNPIPFF